jgi:voltage-gated potassium channel Kch
MAKKHKRSALEKLQKHWQRATAEECRTFLASVYGKAGDPGGAHPDETLDNRPDGGDALIANGRYLLPLTVARIEKIMIARRIGPSEVMAEMGFAGQGTALARALIRKASIRLLVISALQRWLRVNEAAEMAEPGYGTPHLQPDAPAERPPEARVVAPS